ncbi:DUF917 domain-containing protein [Candidatus Symbiopectobacterium sp. NZEC127]|uniref:DUF917 domain-containing protein n=2 Tax=unclassified Symbiopectobacterium TaxID=2794573 RepID=UPI002227CA70|nr:DUF917 domain-containing protein [Candidatus Symbiopectobacterium sp. NZEC127]MCW2488470.1 DUF917 domain-containing protein [Candidatus Symbiopectobacterium sp. NZEC127]
MILLDIKAIEHICYGASILASGGGGDPHLGKIMAQQAIEKHGPIRLISIEELQPDDILLSTGMIGAPTIMMEKIPNGEESILACRRVEQHLRKSITAIYPIEAGGINSLLPLATACRLGLPVLDVDGMGRAFPQFHMTTFYLDNINASPFIVVDEKLNTVLIDAVDGYQSEIFARDATVKMGGAAIFAAYPISPIQAKKSGIAGTISLMKNIGEKMQQAISNKDNLVNTLINLLQGHVLFRGKLNRVNQRSEGGFTYGHADFSGLDNKKKNFKVLFQNEYLLALENDNPLCMTPDLIIIIDEDSGIPILAEKLSYGMNVVAIGVPANNKWRSQRGIEVCGPRYFKYPMDYSPVEDCIKAYK